MPEINFQINLPDGKKASLYSPSTVILEYLKPGDSLKISDFKSLAIQALHKASEKVRAKYGFACTRTLEEEEKILSWISNYDPDQLISISMESMSANLLNNTALPSITGLEAKAPRFPIPNIAEPLLITATRFPLLV